jgi:O-acetylhomoserine (thiol)-lyase
MKRGFTTSILHSDRLQHPEHGSLHKPIHTSVTYGYEDIQDLADIFQNKKSGYAYSRQGNPTVSALEHKITQMENGQGSIAFSTGMAAIAGSVIPLIQKGDHIIASSYLFGNTRSFFQTLIDIGVDITFVDATLVENVQKEIKKSTKIIFVETIANPATQVADLKSIGDLCEEHHILYIVDNTITSPYLFKPTSVKAGLIINSLTKYIGGHGNALGGSVTDTGIFNWESYPAISDILKKDKEPNLWGLAQIRKKGLRDAGGTLSPEAAHSISIGSETLALRIERSSNNALQLARFFESHSLISKVFYPGLNSHPQHVLASTLFSQYSSLMSIELKKGVDCFQFLNHLSLIIKSSNLGDNRSLAIPVAHTIFYELGAERRAEMGISDSMIRLSIGIEDIKDLLEDFDKALGNFKS